MAMSNRSLIRWGGLLYVLAGLSLIIQQVFHPAQIALPGATGIWVLVHTIGYFGLALGLLGLVAVYARQKEKAGKLGLIGFVLAFLGNALTVGAAFLDSYLLPVLVANAPAVLGAPPTDPGPLFGGPAGIIILLSSLTVTVGFVLFGIATWRAGVLPRWAALIVIVSAWFGIAAIFSQAIFSVAAIVFSIGNAWLGYAVWADPGPGD
jgi:hypothetical protein